jgi:hypothetical protein
MTVSKYLLISETTSDRIPGCVKTSTDLRRHFSASDAVTPANTV